MMINKNSSFEFLLVSSSSSSSLSSEISFNHAGSYLNGWYLFLLILATCSIVLLNSCYTYNANKNKNSNLASSSYYYYYLFNILNKQALPIVTLVKILNHKIKLKFNSIIIYLNKQLIEIFIKFKEARGTFLSSFCYFVSNESCLFRRSSCSSRSFRRRMVKQIFKILPTSSSTPVSSSSSMNFYFSCCSCRLKRLRKYFIYFKKFIISLHYSMSNNYSFILVFICSLTTSYYLNSNLPILFTEAAASAAAAAATTSNTSHTQQKKVATVYGDIISNENDNNNNNNNNNTNNNENLINLYSKRNHNKVFSIYGNNYFSFTYQDIIKAKDDDILRNQNQVKKLPIPIINKTNTTLINFISKTKKREQEKFFNSFKKTNKSTTALKEITFFNNFFVSNFPNNNKIANKTSEKANMLISNINISTILARNNNNNNNNIHQVYRYLSDSHNNTPFQSNYYNIEYSAINDTVTTSLTTLTTPTWNHPLLGLLLVTMTLVTICGNGLVIIAVIRERYLKSATNYYIASLACADLLVGLVVMPFNSLNKMTNDFWFFGDVFCDIWHSLDVFGSTASINSLLFIALDRHSAISDPISYHTSWLTRYWIGFVAMIWIGSACISFPAIAYWRWITSVYLENRCIFPDDIHYLVFSSLISFYIPLIIMIIVYYRIYVTATRQMNALKTGQKHNVKTGDGSTPLTLRIHRGGYHKLNTVGNNNINNTGGTSSHGLSLSNTANKLNSSQKSNMLSVNSNRSIRNQVKVEYKTELSVAKEKPTISLAIKKSQVVVDLVNEINNERKSSDESDEKISKKLGGTNIKKIKQRSSKQQTLIKSFSMSFTKLNLLNPRASPDICSIDFSKHAKQKSSSCNTLVNYYDHAINCVDTELVNFFKNESTKLKIIKKPNESIPSRIIYSPQSNRPQVDLKKMNDTSLTSLSSFSLTTKNTINYLYYTSLITKKKRNQSALTSNTNVNNKLILLGTKFNLLSDNSIVKSKSSYSYHNTPDSENQSKTSVDISNNEISKSDIEKTIPEEAETLSTNNTEEKNKPTRKRFTIARKNASNLYKSFKNTKIFSKNRPNLQVNEVNVDEEIELKNRNQYSKASLSVNNNLIKASSEFSLYSQTSFYDEATSRLDIDINNEKILRDKESEANNLSVNDSKEKFEIYKKHYYDHSKIQNSQDRSFIRRILLNNRNTRLGKLLTMRKNFVFMKKRNQTRSDSITMADSAQAGDNSAILKKKAKHHMSLGKKLRNFSREQKAAKTLGIVMGVFIICWLPFFIYNIITGLFKAKSHDFIYSFLTWLGYVNSGCNPIIYAFSSRDFRRAFYKILCTSKFLKNKNSLMNCNNNNNNSYVYSNTKKRYVNSCVSNNYNISSSNNKTNKNIQNTENFLKIDMENCEMCQVYLKLLKDKNNTIVSDLNNIGNHINIKISHDNETSIIEKTSIKCISDTKNSISLPVESSTFEIKPVENLKSKSFLINESSAFKTSLIDTKDNKKTTTASSSLSSIVVFKNNKSNQQLKLRQKSIKTLATSFHRRIQTTFRKHQYYSSSHYRNQKHKLYYNPNCPKRYIANSHFNQLQQQSQLSRLSNSPSANSGLSLKNIQNKEDSQVSNKSSSSSRQRHFNFKSSFSNFKQPTNQSGATSSNSSVTPIQVGTRFKFKQINQDMLSLKEKQQDDDNIFASNNMSNTFLASSFSSITNVKAQPSYKSSNDQHTNDEYDDDEYYFKQINSNILKKKQQQLLQQQQQQAAALPYNKSAQKLNETRHPAITCSIETNELQYQLNNFKALIEKSPGTFIYPADAEFENTKPVNVNKSVSSILHEPNEEHKVKLRNGSANQKNASLKNEHEEFINYFEI